ncbi:MAG: type II toxin-antitoxin system HicA family toxin [Chloroflexi bacterium]|nr:type II toxin-antitoxin system HicA family toxin [Chloroflexota bacterium]
MPKVRDAIRRVRDDGWIHDRTNGSHRIYVHPEKPSIVVIAGHPGEEMQMSMWQQIMKQAGLR